MKITTKEKQRLKRNYLRKIRSERFQTAMSKQSWAITKKDPEKFAEAIKKQDARLAKKLAKRSKNERI